MIKNVEIQTNSDSNNLTKISKIEIGIGETNYFNIQIQDINKILIILVHIVWMDWLWHYMWFIIQIHLNNVQSNVRIWEEIVIQLELLQVKLLGQFMELVKICFNYIVRCQISDKADLKYFY